MKDSSKAKFLNKILANNITMAEIIKKYNLWDGEIPTYDMLTQINAHRTNSYISQKDILHIYKVIYDFWYDYLTSHKNQFAPEQIKDVKSFLLNKKYSKKNMTEQDCFDFIHSSNDVLYSMNFPIHSQYLNEPPIDSDGNISEDYIHCMPFQEIDTRDISCRLYLNIKPENICALTEQLLKKCLNKKYPLYFKFWTNDNRNDGFLIYTDYNHIKGMLNILNTIKKENPKIFEGCEKINPLLTNINNFIGFAEEPSHNNSSFNLERARAIDTFFNQITIKERKKIGNYTETLLDEQGNKLSLEEYLIYIIEEAFHQTILKNISNDDAKNYDRELPPFIKEQIKEQALIYLQGLKYGKIIYEKPKIKLLTRNLNVFSDAEKDAR